MMHSDRSPGLNASFGLPQLPRTVPGRPRVVQLFEDAFAAGPLVILRAATGSGKTAAAADWAAGSEGPVAWISLGDEDCSSPPMWNRILRSCSHLAPPGSPASATLAGAIAEMEAGALLPELLLRAIAEIGPVTLILDGMKPCADPAFLKELVKLLGTLPSCRAVLIYQDELFPGQSNLLRSVDVTYIRDEALFLTADEVRRQVLSSGSSLDPDLVFLHTYGFPLLVRSLLTAHDAGPISGTSRDIENLVGSWIRAGVFSTVEAAEGYAEFMIKTSVAETLTVDLATKLTGRTDSADILSRLAARGLIRKESGGAYRYRRPVRMALSAELVESHPGWVAACRGIMIEHYLEAGMVPRALSTAVRGRDYAAAEQIASRCQDQLLFLHPDESANILADIPDVKMLRHPLLAMTAGLLLSRATISRDRGTRLLEAVLAGLEAARSSSKPENRQFFPLAEMVALRVAGRPSEALRVVPKAVDVVESACPSRQGEIAGAATSVYVQAGLTLFLEGWTKEARVHLRRAASTPPAHGDSPGMITCLGLLGLSYVSDGRVRDAEKVLSIADGYYPESGLDSWLHAPYLVARAYCAVESGAPKEAVEILTRDGLDLAASELWPIALMIRALAEMFIDPDRVNLDDIEREISGTIPRPTSNYARNMLMVGLSGIHLAAGNPGKAAAALDGLDGGPAAQLGRARLALAEGDFAKAEKALPPEGKGWQVPERAESQILLMRAAIAGHAGRTEEARKLHSQALQLIRRSGLGSLSCVLPDPAMVFLPGLQEATPLAFSIPAVSAPVHLTARERIVLMKLAVSESAAHAAEEMGVSLNTVKAQSRSIYRKLNVSTLRDALAEARSLRLI